MEADVKKAYPMLRWREMKGRLEELRKRGRREKMVDIY
jgi:hypothetical protein